MPAVTTAFGDLLGTKFQTYVVNYGKENPRLWSRWGKSVDMETTPYLSAKISGIGKQYPKPEGQQFVPDLPIPGPSFSITATAYGQMFSTTWEMTRDDKYGVIGEMYTDMARSNRDRQEVQFFAAWPNNAFSVATGYDGLSLYHTAHPDLDGTTQANRPTVEVTLSRTAIQAGQVNFDLLNNERSRPVGMASTRVMIHPKNRYLARRIFGSNGQSGTANNDTNDILEDDLSYGVVRYMVRTEDWTLSAPMAESDLQFMWRDRPFTRSFDDPFIMAVDQTIYQRFAVRVGDWRWTYGSSVGF
jgi:hypothetical protein